MVLDVHYSISPVYYISRCIFSWPFKYKKGQTVPLSVMENIFVGIISALQLISLFWSLYQRSKNPRVKIHIFHSLLDDVSTISATLLTLATTLLTIMKKTTTVAVTFFKQLTMIDKMLQISEDTHKKCYTCFRNKALIQILLVMAVALIDNVMWTFSEGILVTVYYLHSYVMYILNNIATLQIECKIILLRERFIALNERLSELIKEVTEQQVQNNIQSVVITQSTEETIRSFNKIFDILCDLIESINKCHGIQIIILALTILTVVLNTLVIGFTLFKSISEETQEVVCVSMQFAWSAYYIMLGMILTGSTSSTVKSAKKVSTLSHKLLLEYSSKYEGSENFHYTKEELKLLIEQVAYRNPIFSAAGFFTVDYTMLYAIVGAVTSYFIVLLQLP